MFAKTYGSTTLGVNGVLIDVEVDVSRGLPRFEGLFAITMLS